MSFNISLISLFPLSEKRRESPRDLLDTLIILYHSRRATAIGKTCKVDIENYIIVSLPNSG